MDYSNPSLYQYRKYEFVKDNKQECNNIKALQELFATKKLSAADVIILEVLYKYNYLHKKGIETCIHHDPAIEERFKKDNYKNRLAQLSSYGIIRRYYFKWIDEDGSEKRTPFIYTLTRASILFLKLSHGLQFNIEDYLKLEHQDTILKQIVSNQVLVNFNAFTTVACRVDTRLTLSSTVYKKKHVFYGLITVVIDEKNISFSIEPVRRNPNWEQQLVATINLVQSIFKDQKYKYKFPAAPTIIFVCEDDTHIQEVFNALDEKNIDVSSHYFTTDARIITQELSNSLISCSKDDNNNFILQRSTLAFWQ